MAGRDGDNEIYSWGWGNFGQLGHGDEKMQVIPKSIDKVSLQGQQIVTITCGISYSTAITKKGDVFTWGYGKYGQLGHNDRRHQTIPRRVKALQRKGVTKLAVGREHTVALSSDGEIYTWGNGAFGVLGHGSENDQTEPTLLIVSDLGLMKTKNSFHKERQTVITKQVGPEGIVFTKVHSITDHKIVFTDVACGAQHTLMLCESGRVYSCGLGLNGRLGHGDTESRLQPELVKQLDNKAVVSIHSGWSHSVARTKFGQVFTWGAGRDAQLGAVGLESNRDQLTPSLLSRFVRRKKGGEEEETITPIAKVVQCGGKHNLLLSDSGVLFTWGNGSYGRLGHGSYVDAQWPTEVSYFKEKGIKLKAVAGGGYHSMALTESGALYTWGCGEYGRLGHGDEKHQNSPVLVQALSGKYVTSINAGAFMSVAMTEPQTMKQGRSVDWWGKGCPIS